MNAREVIVRPVVSEKSYADAEKGKYTFVIAPTATKPQVRSAVEEIWNVRVSHVNTLKRRGKAVRRHWQRGRRADTRRAIVTLKPGDTIPIFEGG